VIPTAVLPASPPGNQGQDRRPGRGICLGGLGGDIFSLGAQSWQIREITHNDVLVLPAKSGGVSAPFWKGEENGRDFHFSERIGRFLEEADERLDDPDFLASLQQERRMEEKAAGRLVDFLKRQRDETGCSLPHRHHLLVESISRGPGEARETWW